ncbi:MAG TPA: cyclic nucleotide-binding domain-containing protein [bacterium]|nr:cyclic nucleotide-binding domain-containing protein [bacterium]
MGAGDFLKATVLCRDMAEDEVVALAGAMTERSVEAQATVFGQNDPGSALYVVREGGIKITRKGADGAEKILGLMRPGDVFGELSFLDGSPRSAAAKTVQATQLLELDRAAYERMLGNQPPALAAKVVAAAARLMAGRLRNANERIVNAVQWGSGGTASAGAAAVEAGEGEAAADSGYTTIQRLIDDAMEIKLVFPEGGEMLGKIKAFRNNELNLPEFVLMDSTLHQFIIPYAAIKYIFPMEKKKSTSKFL